LRSPQQQTAGARILHPTEFFHSGATTLFALQTDQRFSYWLYVPTVHQNTTEPLPLVVIMHGTARTAERYRTMYSEFAEQHGCIVLAPLFPAGIIDPEDLHGYKRIGYHDIRFDRLLLDMVDQIGRRYRVRTEKFLMHGFSGGGQFAHRFTYLHPDRLDAVSIGAPGRVTRINNEIPWWLGTSDVAERFGIEIDIAAIRRLPIQMIVGADDTDTWEIAEPGIDAGGDTRVERLMSLRDNWESHGIPVRFDLIPGMTHRGSVAREHVEPFLAEVLSS
jgi:poly(3-hydroxybutyrate) depolymerase